MRNTLTLALAAAFVSLQHVPATAQAPRLECPEGAIALDVTPLLLSSSQPGTTCGTPRNPSGSGPCDDGYYQLTAPPALWPEGIPFGSRVVPSLYFNVNGAISFDTPIGYFAPEGFPSTGVELIAAHLTDVDLRDSVQLEPNPGRMLLCQDFAAGRIIATRSEVGFYERSFIGVGLNTYQVVLEKSELVCTTATGETRTSLGVELRYVELGWYAANTNQGNPQGLCEPGQAFGEGGFCQPARAGMNPNGQPATLLEGSGTRSINPSLLAGSEAPGVFRFLVHAPDVASCACPEGTERQGARCFYLRPSADAGDDLEVVEASDVVLDATGSRDDLGRALSFAWTQVGGPAVVLVDEDTATPMFAAPEGPTTLTFEVEVCNTLAICDTDEVVVEVVGLPDIIVADQTVTVGSGASLDASASSDPQSLPLEFTWTQVAGTPVTLTGPTTPRPRFSAPNTPGELVFQVLACNSFEACTNAMARVDVTCRDGFTTIDDLCEDVDECAATPSPCDPNAACDNSPGGFTCECNDGYAGDGETCTDIDECAAATSPCAPNAACTNTAGSFTCECDGGFTGDGRTCTDIDECAEDVCHTTALCTNAVGTYSCACPSGTTGDPRTGCLANNDASKDGDDDSGCASGGASPLWVLLALALVLSRRRPTPRRA